MKIIIKLCIIALVLSGCSRHVISYEPAAILNRVDRGVSVSVTPFLDNRPVEEREGRSGKFMGFASKDDDFSEPPQISIANLLKKELQGAGFKVAEGDEAADYRISGEILHFQTMVKLPGTTVIPYLGTLSTLWESDEFTTVVSIKARMEAAAEKRIIFEREFNISEELRLKTGILNLERWFGRGMGYQFKLLNMALADVLGQIRDEALKAGKKIENILIKTHLCATF